MEPKNPILIKTAEELVRIFGQPPTTVGGGGGIAGGQVYVDSQSNHITMTSIANNTTPWNGSAWSEDSYGPKGRSQTIKYEANGSVVYLPLKDARERLVELDDIKRLSTEFPQIEDAYKKLLTLVKLHNSDAGNPDS